MSSPGFFDFPKERTSTRRVSSRASAATSSTICVSLRDFPLFLSLSFSLFSSRDDTKNFNSSWGNISRTMHDMRHDNTHTLASLTLFIQLTLSFCNSTVKKEERPVPVLRLTTNISSATEKHTGAPPFSTYMPRIFRYLHFGLYSFRVKQWELRTSREKRNETVSVRERVARKRTVKQRGGY